MKQGLLPYGVEVVEAADTVTARGGLALATVHKSRKRAGQRKRPIPAPLPGL